MFEPNEKVLSDHLPFRTKIQMKNGKSIMLLTFNMMNKMGFIENTTNYAWSYLNNGVGCIAESSTSYRARLNILAKRINNWIKRHKSQNPSVPILIALQEGPLNHEDPLNKDQDYFCDLLDSNFKKNVVNKYTNSIITLSDSHYNYALELTDSMKQAVLTQGLKERTLITVFVDSETKESIALINVHANYKQPIIEDVKTLCKKAKELKIEHLIFSGDHNRNLSQIEESHAQADISTGQDILSALGMGAFNIPNASFVSKLKPEDLAKGVPLDTCNLTTPIIESRDGVILANKLKIDQKIELDLYVVSATHPQYKNLDSSLLNIPQGFLEKFKDTENQNKYYFSFG